VNRLDYIVLFATILAIPLYGLWRTYNHPNLREYLKGDKTIRWGTIGLSVLATQAGPITFLSMPGQAYESGIGFIQNYFGQPLALIVVCAVFVPIYQRLKVYTAYEYLGQRFDKKTRLLGGFLFLIQRGIAGGITIYAPAIILSALLGWDLNLTIWLAGGFVIRRRHEDRQPDPALPNPGDPRRNGAGVWNRRPPSAGRSFVHRCALDCR